MSDPYLVIKKRRKTRTATGAKRYRLSQRAEKSASAATAYFRSKIRIDAAIAEGADGYYTWIFKDTPLLAAAKTRSEQELGTLHANLDALTPAGTVVAAGEFMKRGDYVVINLQSGSFMKTKFGKLRSKAAKLRARDELIGLAIAEFARVGLKAEFYGADDGAPEEEELAGKPMIDKAEIITTLSDIAEYDRLLSASDETA